MARKCCLPTCGNKTKWPTSGCCSCRCHEYGVDYYDPLSMIPASKDDRAIFSESDTPLGFISEQIAMWAICRVRTEYKHPNENRVRRKEIKRRIVGMMIVDGGIESAEETSNFLGYADASCTDDLICDRFGLKPPRNAR
jgi:hypothetical protein